MDDIDRTFEKLKRQDIRTVIANLQRSGKIGNIKVDPLTFMRIVEIRNDELKGTGWDYTNITDKEEVELGAKIIIKEI